MVLKLLCYELFDQFDRHVECVRKNDQKVLYSFIEQLNNLKTQVRSKVILYQTFLFYW